MNVEVLLAGGAALLSLVFNLFPSSESWFANLPTLGKRGIMALLVLGWTLFIYGMACAGTLLGRA